MWEEISAAIIERNSKLAINLINSIDPSELDIKDSSGSTLLILAAKSAMDDVCKLLILKMTSETISVANNLGDTALISAIINGLDEICELLIPKMTRKAINAADFLECKALTYAIRSKKDDISISLIFASDQKSLCINSSSLMNTPLKQAIINDMTEVSKMLIPLIPTDIIKTSKIYDKHSEVHSKTLLEYTEQHNQLSLYKMLFAKIHSSYESAFGKKDEIELGDLVKSVKKSIFRLADFIVKSFANSDSEKSEPALIKFEDFNKFKFYQQINRDLLKSCIDHLGENGASLLKKVDTYIAVKYFTIAGITQSINLPEDPANHIFSYLEFPSLLAINTFEANAVGTTGESSSDTLSAG